MQRKDIISRVRAYTRDLSASIFRTVDVVDFINEGADRLKGRINQLSTIPVLIADEQSPDPLPASYHYLLAVYSASRCFSQDERHYQASTLMNEFETKLEELLNFINDGTIVIKDADGVAIASAYTPEYVTNVYFKTSSSLSDVDTGVNGVN